MTSCQIMTHIMQCDDKKKKIIKSAVITVMHPISEKMSL